MADIVASLISLGLGILWLIGSNKLSSNNLGGDLALGPDFFPRLLAYFIIVLSITYLGRTIYLNKKEVKGSKVKLKMITIHMIIAFTLYLLAVNYIGYVVSTFIYLIANILMLSTEKSYKDLLPTALIVVCLYGVFHMILNVPLPKGILI